MTKKVSALMSAIDDVLSERTQDSADVWNLLTALRSEDNEISPTSDALGKTPPTARLKRNTTMVLRAKLFPKLADLGAWCGVWGRRYPGLNSEGALDTIYERGYSDHFAIHFNEAVGSFNRVDVVPFPEEKSDAQ